MGSFFFIFILVATTYPGQSGPGSNASKGVLPIIRCSFVSYPGYWWGGVPTRYTGGVSYYLIAQSAASLQRDKTPTNECPGYDTKQSDGEVPAMQELCGMRGTPSLPSLPGPLWPEVVAPDMGPIYGLNRTNGILMLNWIVWLNWRA